MGDLEPRDPALLPIAHDSKGNEDVYRLLDHIASILAKEYVEVFLNKSNDKIKKN